MSARLIHIVVVLSMTAISIGAQSLPQQRHDEKAKRTAAAPTCKNPDAVYQYGEVRRIVRGGENPLIHIGMIQSGATIIEFPANDYYFAVSTSDIGDWVRVEKSLTRKTDHHIVLRPGKDLQGNDSAAIVQVQMDSGLLVTICVHPVKFAGAHANRVVLSYDRNEIVEARKRAGLAVNLRPVKTEEQPAPAPSASLVPPSPAPTPQAHKENIPAKEPPVTAPAQKVEQPEHKPDARLSEALKQALAEVMREPREWFKKWSDPSNGLTVATRTYDFDEDTRIALVAVRNVQDGALRILPGHPEVIIETLNNKGKSVQTSAISKRLEESSAKNQMIPGRQTVYYAIAYSPPILSTKQKVRITVGQRSAADAPVAVDITRRNDK